MHWMSGWSQCVSLGHARESDTLPAPDGQLQVCESMSDMPQRLPGSIAMHCHWLDVSCQDERAVSAAHYCLSERAAEGVPQAEECITVYSLRSCLSFPPTCRSLCLLEQVLPVAWLKMFDPYVPPSEVFEIFPVRHMCPLRSSTL